MNVGLLELHQLYNKHEPVKIGTFSDEYDLFYCACGVFFCSGIENDDDELSLVCGIAKHEHRREWAAALAAHPELKPAFVAWAAVARQAKYKYNRLEKELLNYAKAQQAAGGTT
jgi:hypothetical protein